MQIFMCPRVQVPCVGNTVTDKLAIDEQIAMQNV